MARIRLVLSSGSSAMRAFISQSLFDAVRRGAKSDGLPYKRFIREAIECETAKRNRPMRKTKKRLQR